MKRFYVAYLLALLVCFVLEMMNIVSFRLLISGIVGLLLLIQLVTRVPFLSHDYATLREMEQLASEQRSVMSWKTFIALLLPLIVYQLIAIL